MKKLVFIAAMMAWMTTGIAQVPTLQTGIKHLENENYEAALAAFTAIAKADPKNGTVYYYIGEVSYRTDAYDEAEKSYRKGLDINSRCAECKVGLGKLALDKGKTEEATDYFTSAGNLDKKNPEVFALIGEAYLFARKPNGNKAVEYLETAKDMNPKVARYWAHLGDAYKMIGENGPAMTCYETAVDKDPANTSAYISMARIWSAARQPEAAIEKLKKAIELSPDDALPYKDLIEQYIKTQEYDKVTPLLEKYVQLTGSDVSAKVRLVKFLTFQAQDYDRAIQYGEDVLKTNPDQYTLHRWLAWAYFEKGMYQQSHDHSVQLFDDIKKKEERQTFPSDYEYWAKASFKLGMLDEAAHIYRKYLDIDSTRAEEIYGMLAKAYFDAKNYPQAVKYYLLKREVKPLTLADEYYLGLAYFYQDLNLEADSSFARVLSITPDYAPGWMMRARIGNRLDTAEAKLFLSKEAYENYVIHASSDKDKNKKNLIESYNYLAWYAVQHEDNEKAKEYYELILMLEPENAIAMDALKLLKEQ